MLARSLSRVEEAEEKVLADAADLYKGVPIKPWTPETASDAVPGARRVAPSNAMTAATSAVKAAVPQVIYLCLLYTSPSPRDKRQSRMPSSA